MKCMLPLVCCLLALTGPATLAQRLQPGFDKAEYIELLRVSSRQAGDSVFYAGVAAPKQFRRVYRSPVVGLDNRWDLWSNGRGTVVVSLRGTTQNNTSWLENFYAAMLPAKGELRLSKERTFRYELAQHPQAAVHAGWLLGMASLADDIASKIDSCYRRGTQDVVVLGHSQGGAIAYLLTSHLRNLQSRGELPADVRLKTYCSAAPKPGNLHYAYEYEAQTYGPNGGWGFNVVNAADWVPETPISIQTLTDFNPTNPFVGARGIIRKQSLPKRLALGYVYRQLDKPTRKAQRNYQRYLGTFASREVRKTLPEYQPGTYYASNNYVRTGRPVVLQPTAEYHRRFPDDPKRIFAHHLFLPYLYLAERLP
ncbi:lipase family protein [Hymenobacter oligotrophus]|uniref:Lipase family protein n=1 Tax=Hymenobacter oligotrophus TaxID=2319843 RepID=A0A3B7QSR4_9BACT|nr:lipase family protein [Hymenobacter oligotrophus]AYA36048.1 lipase family protein [Hymenobacter oligotrophus]